MKELNKGVSGICIFLIIKDGYLSYLSHFIEMFHRKDEVNFEKEARKINA